MSLTNAVPRTRPSRIVWLAVAAAAGCSSSGNVGTPTGGTGAGGTRALTIPLGDASARSTDTRPAAPTEDANCGSSARTMEQLPADLLLVLDRSGSMTSDIATDDPCDVTTGGCSERWATMLSAMQNVLANSPTSIHWGLKLFSSPGIATGQGATPVGCVVLPAMEVPVDVGKATDIVAAIAASAPNYNTPTRAAIETASSYLVSLADGRPKYILLATDGQPNCATGGEYATSPDLPATLKAIASAYAAGIKVYVIGVGPSAGNLDEMAKQGGTGQFYPALSPQSLLSALSAIVGTVASCVYTMTTPPPDPNNLGVYLDKQLVPQSSLDGWTLASTNSVAFNGPTCERIKAGRYSQVQVLFGCPGSDLPQVIP